MAETDATTAAAERSSLEEVDFAAVAAVEQHHRRQTVLRVGILLATGLVVLAAAVGATAVGTADIGFVQVLRAFAEPVTSLELTGDALRDARIVRELRLPRIAMAVVAGASLSVAGVVMQGLLRNPLVSPFTVGISSAAAFGASVAIVFGASMSGTGGGVASIVGSALLAALACAALVFGLSLLRRMSAEAVILVGIALSYLFGALTATLQLIATEEQVAAIVRWTFGSLNGATWQDVGILAAAFLVVLPIVAAGTGSLNAVAFGGDEVATSLGVNVVRLRVVQGVVVVALSAVIISFTGVIGFVGLVGPHIARLLIGGDHRYLVPFSMLTGALLVLAADTLGRSLFAPAIIPVGIVISYLGVPLFLNLIFHRRREYF